MRPVAQIFPYRIRDGSVIEWHICIVDECGERGSNIIRTARVEGTRDDAEAEGVKMLKKKVKKPRSPQ